MTHRHTAATTATTAFIGPVSGARENAAAHGGVTYVDTCRCGAQRRVNVNGGHQEVGSWGPDAAEQEREARTEALEEARARVRRRAALRQQAAELLSQCEPVVLSRGPASARVEVDAEGFIIVTPLVGDCPESVHPLVAAGAPWFSVAQQARQLLLEADGEAPPPPTTTVVLGCDRFA